MRRQWKTMSNLILRKVHRGNGGALSLTGCRYYGQKCSTLLGIMTARMMPRDEGKALDPILFMLSPAPPRA